MSATVEKWIPGKEPEGGDDTGRDEGTKQKLVRPFTDAQQQLRPLWSDCLPPNFIWFV